MVGSVHYGIAMATGIAFRVPSRHLLGGLAASGKNINPNFLNRWLGRLPVANPLPHGKLLKLGIDIGQTSVAMYGAQERTAVPRTGGLFFGIANLASINSPISSVGVTVQLDRPGCRGCGDVQRC